MWAWFKNHVGRVVLETWRGWQKDDGFLLSAAMAYYAAFSLLPLCLVLIAILGVTMRLSSHAEDAQAKLVALAAQNMGPWFGQQLQGLLLGVKTRAGLGGPIGTLVLLVGAVGVFVQFDSMFDRIWGTTPAATSTGWLGYLREALYDRVSAFLMLLAVGALVVAVFLANVVLTAAAPYIDQLPAGHAAWQWGQLGFNIGSNALLFAIIYKVLPKVDVPWRAALLGGVFVAVVWLIGQRLLVSFVIGTGYSAYGVVGSFIAVMLWLYYASATIFFGAELVRALGERADLPSPACGRGIGGEGGS